MVKNVTPRQFPPIIERIEDLQAALGHLDARTKVIAFDLFDAVLERNDATPDDLRKILARRIMRTLLDSFGIHCLTGEILQTLQEIEAKLSTPISPPARVAGQETDLGSG